MRRKSLTLKTQGDLLNLICVMYTDSRLDLYETDLYAFKVVAKDSREGIYNGGIPYLDGETIIDSRPLNHNSSEECGTGLNIATLEWCKAYKRNGYAILKIKFDVHNICFPYSDSGKFRVQSCTVIGEVDSRGYRIKGNQNG